MTTKDLMEMLMAIGITEGVAKAIVEEKATNDPYTEGYKAGYEEGYDDGYEMGELNSEDDYVDGYNDGYEEGYESCESDSIYNFSKEDIKDCAGSALCYSKSSLPPILIGASDINDLRNAIATIQKLIG